MSRKKGKTSLQGVLRGNVDASKQEHIALDSDLKELFNALSGRELADAVIVRVQRYAVEKDGLSIDDDFEDIDGYELDRIRETIRDKLMYQVSKFISDDHRLFAIRGHAQGLSTTDVVERLIFSDAVMHRLAQADAVGVDIMRKVLVHRLSYLKPGTARWPEQKYGSVWREAREKHKEAIRDIALTSPVEQVALLAKHAERINYVLNSEDNDVKELHLLTNALTRTVESLKKVSAVEDRSSVSLSGPQLVAVLERLTLALDAPEQLALDGGTDAVVSALEKLVIALKGSGQKAIGTSAEVSGQDAEVVVETGSKQVD